MAQKVEICYTMFGNGVFSTSKKTKSFHTGADCDFNAWSYEVHENVSRDDRTFGHYFQRLIKECQF